jgi:hypothetical protein
MDISCGKPIQSYVLKVADKFGDLTKTLLNNNYMSFTYVSDNCGYIYIDMKNYEAEKVALGILKKNGFDIVELPSHQRKNWDNGLE